VSRHGRRGGRKRARRRRPVRELARPPRPLYEPERSAFGVPERHYGASHDGAWTTMNGKVVETVKLRGL
jgi:hypothetical protein